MSASKAFIQLSCSPEDRHKVFSAVEHLKTKYQLKEGGLGTSKVFEELLHRLKGWAYDLEPELAKHGLGAIPVAFEVGIVAVFATGKEDVFSYYFDQLYNRWAFHSDPAYFVHPSYISNGVGIASLIKHYLENAEELRRLYPKYKKADQT